MRCHPKYYFKKICLTIVIGRWIQVIFLGNFVPFLLVFRSVFRQRHLIVESTFLGMFGFLIFEVRFRDAKAKISFVKKNSMNKKMRYILEKKNLSSLLCYLGPDLRKPPFFIIFDVVGTTGDLFVHTYVNLKFTIVVGA